MNNVQISLLVGSVSAVSLVLGWAASTFNFLKLRTKYDATAEAVENITAEQLESAAKYLQSKADELRAPGE